MSIFKKDEVKRKALGRTKIAIENIQDKAKKQVTFSKRRKGMFNKASELCALCNAQVAVITFSGAGKVFFFGHPSCDDIVKRYIRERPEAAAASASAEAYSLEALARKGELFWWDKSIDGLGLEELEIYKASLEKLRDNVAFEIGNNNDNNVNVNALITRDYLGLFDNKVNPLIDDGSYT